MRIHSFFIVSVFIVFLSSCGHAAKYSADENLPLSADQDSFKYEIIRYVGRLPKHATAATKFESRFDGQYLSMARSMSLDKHYQNPKDGYIYFEISRIAPSLYEKYVSTGGRLKRDEKGGIVEYEEIYRTWKMKREDLEEKTAIFFDYMVKGKDLSRYYTANIGDTEHIEFPDENTYFDKGLKQWRFKDSLRSN